MKKAPGSVTEKEQKFHLDFIPLDLWLMSDLMGKVCDVVVLVNLSVCWVQLTRSKTAIRQFRTAVMDDLIS